MSDRLAGNALLSKLRPSWRWASLPFLLVVWTIAASRVPSYVLPQPWAVAGEALSWIVTGRLWPHVWASVLREFGGLRSFGDGPVIQQAVASGEIDVAYIGAPPVYQWAARGLKAKIIAKVNYGQAALITKADGPILTLSDLKGHKLAGLNRGSGMDVLLRGYVLKEAAGLDPDADVQLSQMPIANMNGALDTGVVEAAFLWEPFVSQSVLRGTGRVVFDVNAALPGYPWYVIAAPEKTIETRRGDLEKLLRAHAKAIEFLQKEPEEANRIIAHHFNLEAVEGKDGTKVSPEAVVAEARKRVGWSATIATSDREFIQRLINYSLSLGFLDRHIDVADIIDDSFASGGSKH